MEIMSRQDKNLLLNGSVCNKDAELKEFLMLFYQFKGITENDVDRLEFTNVRIYNLLKAEDSRKAIVNNCKKEWKFKQPIGAKTFPCQLCGCKHSKNKFIIINKITHTELQIGSSCIEHFPVEDRLKDGNDVLELKDWSDEQIERATQFYSKYKTGKIIFKKWTQKYSGLQLTTTIELDKKFKDILSRGKKFYSNFINNTLPKENTINTFKYIINDFEYFYKECEEYVANNKNDLFICTKNIEKYLDKDVLKIIKKENAKISRTTAKHITSLEFINRFKFKIEEVLNKVNIKLNKISENGIVINYTYGSYFPLNLNISLHNFANNYSEIYFSDKYTTLSNILNDSILIDTFENVDRFLNIIHSQIKDKKYYFIFDEKLHSKKEIEINRTSYNKYAIIDYEELLKDYILALGMNSKEMKQFLLQKIDNLNWIDKKEKKKFDIGDISKTNTKNIRKDEEKQYIQYESEEEYYQRIKKQRNGTIKI